MIWIYLLVARGGYWMTREIDLLDLPDPQLWPSVTAVVPARDEGDVVAETIASLVAQDYPGQFRIVLVDDHSSDGTGAIARGLRRAGPARRHRQRPRPPGWTGKLWAVAQGVAHARTASPSDYLWLTDADIRHAPENLRALVTRAEATKSVLVSEMAKLHAGTGRSGS